MSRPGSHATLSRMALAHFYMHMGAGWWLLASAGMLIFWGLVIWAAAAVMRSRGAADTSSPRAILESRLARGEISIEEYQHLRDALDPTSGSTPAHP
jgi:uncharacterized membrane protein